MVVVTAPGGDWAVAAGAGGDYPAIVPLLPSGAASSSARLSDLAEHVAAEAARRADRERRHRDAGGHRFDPVHLVVDVRDRHGR